MKVIHQYVLLTLLTVISYSCSSGSPMPVPVPVEYLCPAVYLGTPVQEDESGIVYLYHSNGDGRHCSAVLLTNDWALTAAHCGSDYEYVGQMGSQTENHSIQVLAHEQYQNLGLTPNYDLMLIQFEKPFTMTGGKSSGYHLPTYNGDVSLVKNVDLYGYGDTCVGKDTSPGRPLTRALDLPIIKISPGELTFGLNSNGQGGAPGDSGGPNFVRVSFEDEDEVANQLIGIYVRGGGGRPAPGSSIGIGTIKEFLGRKVPGY